MEKQIIKMIFTNITHITKIRQFYYIFVKKKTLYIEYIFLKCYNFHKKDLEEKMNSTKVNKEGITLIALIITIILLLILAMVSNLKTNTDISMLSEITY